LPLPAHGPEPRTRQETAQFVAVYPHAVDAFTQGLELHQGTLYESTGLHGRSSLRVVELESGAVLRLRSVPDAFYAEGLTTSGDRLYQLTYQSGVCFVYDLETLEPRGQRAYRGEGWGLTHHEGSLVLSDGTATLRFLDPDTFTERRRLTVRDDEGPVERLNELEMVEGEIFANVWRTDRIARIDPTTGRGARRARAAHAGHHRDHAAAHGSTHPDPHRRASSRFGERARGGRVDLPPRPEQRS
jgi:glutamine cyclotransferase